MIIHNIFYHIKSCLPSCPYIITGHLISFARSSSINSLDIPVHLPDLSFNISNAPKSSIPLHYLAPWTWYVLSHMRRKANKVHLMTWLLREALKLHLWTKTVHSHKFAPANQSFWMGKNCALVVGQDYTILNGGGSNSICVTKFPLILAFMEISHYIFVNSCW